MAYVVVRATAKTVLKFVREFTERLIYNDESQPMFEKHPATIGGGIARVAWAYDDDIDIDYRSPLGYLARTSPRSRADLKAAYQLMIATAVGAARGGGLNDGPLLCTQNAPRPDRRCSAMKLAQRTLSADPDDAEVRAHLEPASAPTCAPIGRLVTVGCAVQDGGIVVGLHRRR